MYDTIQANSKLERKRTSILDNVDRARRNGDMSEVQRLFREAVVPFNKEYPTLMISIANLKTSAQTRQRNRAESVAGLNTNTRGLDRAEREIMGRYAERFNEQ